MVKRMHVLLGLTGMLAWTAAVAELPPNPDNGRLAQEGGEWRAWSAPAGEWLSVENFWLDHAERTDGKYWGRGQDYPPYREVSEYDTFLVDLEQGPCLMEFFHGRWRRAQDVRRWDSTFNDLLGCPHVFD